MDTSEFKSLASFNSSLRSYARQIGARAAGDGQSLRGYDALLAIAACSSGELATIAYLAEKLCIKPQCARNLTNRLEMRGLVSRSFHGEFGRTAVLHLTSEGRSLVTKMAAEDKSALKHLRMQFEV